MISWFGRTSTMAADERVPSKGEVLFLTVRREVGSLVSDRMESTRAQVVPAAGKRATNCYERFGKRIFDLLGSAVLLVVLSPLLLTIAISIRATMGPGIIFRQKRIGKGGRLFTVNKFRSMAPDRRINVGNDHTGVERRKVHKTPDHPLVTPLGRVFRKLSLDELPQLWNVLRGDMSLVGPRPELPWIVAGYEDWQHRRHEVKPGLTGLWQVSGKNKTTFVEMIQLDIKYAKGKTLWWDLKIIFRTIPALMMQMLETRRARKSSLDPVRSKTSYSNHTVAPYSFKKASLVGAVHAAHGDDVWVRKETKLNL